MEDDRSDETALGKSTKRSDLWLFKPNSFRDALKPDGEIVELRKIGAPSKEGILPIFQKITDCKISRSCIEKMPKERRSFILILF
jgi:hypothetical protein